MFYLKNKNDSFYPQNSLKGSATVSDFRNATKIAKLQETESLFFNKISQVDSELDQKREQVQQLEQQIAEKRKRIMLGENEGQGSLIDTRYKQVRDTHFLKAKIKQKENKLSHIRQQHNKAISTKLELRADIDAIRREYETLMQIQDTLLEKIKETNTKKTLESNKADSEAKRVENLKSRGTDHVKQAKTERHALNSNLENILAKLDKDNHQKRIMGRTSSQFESEAIDGNLSEDSLFSKRKKGQHNFLQENAKTLGLSKGAFYGYQKRIMTRTSGQFGNSTSENENRVDDSPKRSNIGGTKMYEPTAAKKKKGHHYYPRENEKTLEEIDNKLMEYRNTLEELRKVTELEDIDDICKLFKEKEDENYSLFQHINLLKTDKEALIKLQKELDFEIKKYEDPTNLMIEERHNEIERLKNELYRKKDKAESLNDKLKNISVKINTLKIGIPVIAKRIGCTPEDNVKEAKDFRDVGDNDLLQYLSLIEKRTNEILQMYDNCQPKEAKDTKRTEKEDVIDFEARNEDLNKMLQDIDKERERAQFQSGVFKETDFRNSIESNIKEAMSKTKTKFMSNRRGR